MSQILSGLILVELQKVNPNPLFLAQQKQLADAIARAVQTYLASSVTIVGTATTVPPVPITGKPLAP
jgi:hypothetical protein